MLNGTTIADDSVSWRLGAVVPAFEICTAQTVCTGWHPKVFSLYTYWQSIGDPDRLPGRQHFDPAKVARSLPNVWMLDVVEEQRRRFKFRLFGSLLASVFRIDHTGKFFDDAHRNSPHLESVTDMLNRVVEEHLVFHGKNRVILFEDRDHVYAEVLIMPLAADGQRVDIILAMTVLTTPTGREF